MSFQRLTAFVLAATAIAPALAHMTMSDPAPFGNPSSDPMSSGNFPCKGMDAFGSAGVSTTITAGSTMNVTLAGSAVHGGGSCQFVISYDNGATFGVLDQKIGGCPTDAQKSFTVNVPAGLPSSDGAVFGWTWFNHIGNREMYMNCAKVAVSGSGSGVTLPGMFVANVGDKGAGCIIPEGTDVDFANPPCNAPGQVSIGSRGSGSPPATPSNPGPSDPAPSNPAPPTSGSSVPMFEKEKVYNGGDQVCSEGKVYTAQWWSQSKQPPGGAWVETGATCSGGASAPMDPAPSSSAPSSSAPASPAPSTGSSSLPMFQKDKVYNTGEQVCYEGNAYTAQWWTTSHLPPGGAWVAAGSTC